MEFLRFLRRANYYRCSLVYAQRLATTSLDDHMTRVWNARTGELTATLVEQSSVLDVTFSPDGQYIVTADDDGTARVWDAVTGGIVVKLEEHSGPVLQAKFSPNGGS